MWSAYLFQTTTGRIGPQLEFAALSWSIDLNGTEQIGLTLRKTELPLVPLEKWLAAWWGGVVLLWNGDAIVAGPIITRPSESAVSVQVSCGGIRSVLANRVILEKEPTWNAGLESEGNHNDQDVILTGLSLGTIAQRVVTQGMKKKAGRLPISFPIPEQAGDHQRTYEGFNVQNVFVDDVLTKLSNVIDGPDIMFKPRIQDGSTVMFDMWHGTNEDPRIAQQFTKVWDTTSEFGEVSNMTVNYTGTYQASRVFSLGAGQDRDLLVLVSTNDAPLAEGYPLLEKVINSGSSDNFVVVREHGKSNLATNSEALVEIQMTVRADGDIPIGKFWPGDLAHVVTKGMLPFKDGVTTMRILSITGDHTNNVRVSLQTDARYDI